MHIRGLTMAKRAVYYRGFEWMDNPILTKGKELDVLYKVVETSFDAISISEEHPDSLASIGNLAVTY